MLLRARTVLPVTAPPIEDGAVCISGHEIVAVGPWRELRNRATHGFEDLGEVALLPGLINAHCHLDYTGFAGHLPPPRSFTDWLQGVLALKAEWSFSEFAASWVAGAHQLLRTGCTTVLDFEAVPELLPEVWQDIPLRVISALELTGVRSGRPASEILAEALAVANRLAEAPAGKSIALAPHAPYSTRPDLVRSAADAARQRGMLISCHVAESSEEFEMFQSARGPMFQWLRGQRDMSDCGTMSPVRRVAECGLLGPNCVVAHANHLDAGDAELLGRTATSVVHCPRSHAYFGRPPFPYAPLRSAGVTVCLGTDSLVSIRKKGRARPTLDMWEEARAFSKAQPDLAPEAVLELATTAGAHALGHGDKLGALRVGAEADIVAIPCNETLHECAAAVLHHVGPVAGVMIRGVWAIPPGGPKSWVSPGISSHLPTRLPRE